MLTRDVATQGGGRLGAWGCEGHEVVFTVCQGIHPCSSCHCWTLGHKHHVVQSDGADGEAQLLEGVGTRGGQGVGVRVARVLDMGGVLGDGSSASGCSKDDLMTIEISRRIKEFSFKMVICFFSKYHS